MADIERCPTCGSSVEVVTGGEGTSHYVARRSGVERREFVPAEQHRGAVEALDDIRTGRAMQLRGQVNVSAFFAALDALLADAPTNRGQ